MNEQQIKKEALRFVYWLIVAAEVDGLTSNDKVNEEIKKIQYDIHKKIEELI